MYKATQTHSSCKRPGDGLRRQVAMTTSSKSRAFLVEEPMSRQLQTVAIAIAGGLAFQWLGVPAGAMSGAMAVTL